MRLYIGTGSVIDFIIHFPIWCQHLLSTTLLGQGPYVSVSFFLSLWATQPPFLYFPTQTSQSHFYFLSLQFTMTRLHSPQYHTSSLTKLSFHTQIIKTLFTLMFYFFTQLCFASLWIPHREMVMLDSTLALFVYNYTNIFISLTDHYQLPHNIIILRPRHDSYIQSNMKEPWIMNSLSLF